MKTINNTVENTIDTLSEYDELDGLGREHLLDDLLDIIHNIHEKDSCLEGRRYELVMYIVEKEAEVPKLHSEILVGSHLSGEEYKLKIMMITDVRKNNSGNIVMDLLCKKLTK